MLCDRDHNLPQLFSPPMNSKIAVKMQLNCMYFATILIGVVGIYATGVDGRDCQEEIIGPRDVSDPTNPYAPQVYGLVANETDPAVINCFVRCLNHAGTYNPALLLVITTNATYKEVRTENPSTEEYEISFNSISTCEAANSYTMEFEYYFHPRSAQMDGAVIVCGVVHPHSQPPCWGQSYAVISYNVDDPTTCTMSTSPTTTISTTTTTTTIINITDPPTTSPTITGTTHTPESMGPSTSDPSTTTTGIVLTNPVRANTTTHIVIPIIVCLVFVIVLAVSITIIMIMVHNHKQRVAINQVNPESATSTASHEQVQVKDLSANSSQTSALNTTICNIHTEP